MTLRRLIPVLVLVCIAFSRPLVAAPAATPPGFAVVLDIKVDEKGAAEDARIASSDDPSPEHILEQITMEKAHAQKFEVRMKDGHPVKYTVEMPVYFPVEGDEGKDSNLAPKPHLHGRSQAQPVYPAELADKGETGGVILEIVVSAEGTLRNVTVLRSSHPLFAAAAVAAVKQWQFSPASRDGVAMSSRCRLAVVFQTDVQEPAWKWRIPPRPALGSYTVLRRTKPIPAIAPEPATPPAPAPAK